jgi:hypothetical protein
MKTIFVLLMLWTNPGGTAGHQVLKADYTSYDACVAGLNHAQKRSELLDSVPDDLNFICLNQADVSPELLP